MAESYSIEAVLKAKVDGFVNGFKQATSTVEGFVSKNEKTFQSFKKVGAVATASGVAVASGLAFAVKKAETFESAMSSVAAISGATGKDLEDLTKTARDWGASTSFSATEAAEGLEYMALAGWNTQQMMGGIGPILHLAEAGALDLGRASDLVTDSMAGLGLEVDDLSGYLDKVATTAANSNTDIDALMEAFVIAGGKFKELNVPLEESTAFLGVLANRGFKASEAGTAVNAIMTRLTSTTGPAAKKLKEMGISAYDSEGNFRGMETVLEDVRKKMDKMTDAERANASEKLAGLNHGKTFTAMLSGLGEEYGELKGKVENSKDALLKMRNTMKDNLQGDMENLSSAFEEIAIAIGTVLLPHVKTMIGFIQSLADKFNGLDDKTITIIAVIAALAAGFLLLIGPIFLLIGFIPSMLAGLAALKIVLVAITGPVGLTIAAIIAIGAALVVAYNKFEWFREVVNSVWQAIVSVIMLAVGGIVAFVQNIAEQISKYWNENGELIRSATENVWNFIANIIGTLLPIIGSIISVIFTGIQILVVSIWENIKGVIQGALDIILGLVKIFAGLFTGDWSAMWDGVKQLFSGAVEFLWNLVQLMLWGKLLKGIAVFAGAFRGAASTMWGVVRGVFTSAITAIRNFFTNGFNAMRNVANVSMNNIRSIISTIWNFIKSVFTSTISTIRKTVSTGFSNVVTAIRTSMTNAVTAVRTKMTEMLSKVTGSVSKFFSAGKDLISGLIKGIKNMGAAAVGAITGVVDGVVNKAKSLLGIKSPSRVFMAIGGFISEGAADGINKARNLAIKASEALGLGVENAFNPQLATGGFDIAGQVDSINRQANQQMQSHLTSELNVNKQPIEINIYDNKEGVRAYVNEANAIDATIRRFD